MSYTRKTVVDSIDRIIHKLFFGLIILSLATLSFCGQEVKEEAKTTQKVKGSIRHDLFSVSFPTEMDGWACGRWGTILHTNDGGKTWTRQVSGIEDYILTSIFFIDAKNGWAVGDGGTILHTSDSGKTWIKQKSPEINFFMNIHFVNTKKGWIVGEQMTILDTEDGGVTWKVKVKGDYILRSISFCDENNGWAAGEYGYIYNTKDSGRTWKKQAGKFGISEETGEVTGDNYISSIVAINPRSAIGVGIDGYIVETKDGGTTWQAIKTNISKTHLFGIASQGGRIVIVGKGFLSTGTLGKWSFKTDKIEPPITYGYMYGIAPRGKKGFVAVGKGGWIYVSDPTGSSWQKVRY